MFPRTPWRVDFFKNKQMKEKYREESIDRRFDRRAEIDRVTLELDELFYILMEIN